MLWPYSVIPTTSINLKLDNQIVAVVLFQSFETAIGNNKKNP
jgi:hypothetical protein